MAELKDNDMLDPQVLRDPDEISRASGVLKVILPVGEETFNNILLKMLEEINFVFQLLWVGIHGVQLPNERSSIVPKANEFKVTAIRLSAISQWVDVLTVYPHLEPVLLYH